MIETIYLFGGKRGIESYKEYDLSAVVGSLIQLHETLFNYQIGNGLL